MKALKRRGSNSFSLVFKPPNPPNIRYSPLGYIMVYWEYLKLGGEDSIFGLPSNPPAAVMLVKQGTLFPAHRFNWVAVEELQIKLP